MFLEERTPELNSEIFSCFCVHELCRSPSQGIQCLLLQPEKYHRKSLLLKLRELGRMIRSPSLRSLSEGGEHSFFFTFFCLRHIGLLASSISCSRTCFFFELRMYVMGEGLGKTSTALSSGITCSFWLILC